MQYNKLKLRELENFLDEGYFDYQGYIEMHAGPHDFVLYEKGSENYEDRHLRSWIKWDSGNYIFTPHCYDAVKDNKEATVEYLEIYKRGRKIPYSAKIIRQEGKEWYWSRERIFAGVLESLEDLKRLLKQIGIKDGN